MKYAYIVLIRFVRFILRFSGILDFYDKLNIRSNFLIWIRSLFAIYDIDEMIKLDLPWWTLSATKEMELFLKSKRAASVFEWGAGASTIWLAKRASSVITIEHNEIWANKVRSIIKGKTNVSIFYHPPEFSHGHEGKYESKKVGYKNNSFESYVKAITRSNHSYDLIVIDGRARSSCFEIALDHLNDGGFILFDNLNRKRYKEVLKKFHNDILVIKTGGLTVALPYTSKTYLVKKAK